MAVKVYTLTNLPKGIFGVEVSPTLLAQAVRTYLGNQRAASAKTLSRGMVAGSTRKIFRQKGTGKARHGAIRAPIFVGGGISHGPDGMQNFKLEMPSKMKRLAVTGALSTRAAAKEIVLMEGTEKADGKTKTAQKLRTKMGMDDLKILIVRGSHEAKIDLGWRNLDLVTVTQPNNLNVHSVLAHKKIVFTQEAMGELEKLYAN